MAKHRYETRVNIEGEIEETQFIPQGAAPRLRTRYVRDSKDHGKYRTGRSYSIDPDKLDAAAEEVLASEDPAVEQQREEERVAERASKKSKR